jgi:hypothetical protein
VLASDAQSGPQGLPKLALPRGARWVVLRPLGDAGSGVLNVYANDARDLDGDGVGQLLERALGTCDAPDEPHCSAGPLARYYARARHGTRDSDRDGLSDADELWGVPGEPLLDLPRFGADPLHKDVFVEIDRSRRVEPPGMSERDLVEVARLYARGSAAALRNPDGLPGVRLHFDAGFEPAAAEHRGLLGDWGGSGRSAGSYKRARKRDFSAARAGYFRYAVLVRSGFGQSHRDAFVVNRDFQPVALFAHELAHTLGLPHHGSAAWGALNCKPNHFSIINYAYQNVPEVGFSTRAGPAINPAAAIERGAVDARMAARLRGPPFELDVVAGGARGGVDWNRDGRISDEPVRAGLTWATYKSCNAAGVGRATLAEDVQAASPALVAVAGRLHAFWIDGQGALAHRTAAVRACQARDERGCTELGQVRTLGGYEGLRAIAATPGERGEVVLAHVAEDGRLHVSTVTTAGDEPVASPPIEVRGARTAHAPAVAWMTVDPARYGVARVLTVLLLANDARGTLMQAFARSAEGPFVMRPVLDASLQPVTASRAPALASLDTGESCAALVDHESLIHLHCYEPARDLWPDLSARAFYAGLGPRTGGPVGLAYHCHRTAHGTAIDGDETRGALYLSFTERAPVRDRTPDNPQLLVSEWLNAGNPAASALHFRWRGAVINQWTHLAPDTALVLYEDRSLAGLAGAMVRRIGQRLQLELLPLVDGAFEAELRGGDDFEVMERGICTELRGAAACADGASARMQNR